MRLKSWIFSIITAKSDRLFPAATTKKLVVMLLFLVGSTVIIGLGNKKSADYENAAKTKMESAQPATDAAN